MKIKTILKMIPSGLTIFLIFVTIMTIQSYIINNQIEDMMRNTCLTHDEMNEQGCWEHLDFYVWRTRLDQYTSMILICLTILSIKVDYK